LLEAFQQHLPGRVDRSYLRDLGFSDSAILTIKTALYFLGLVDDQHEPTERLQKLAQAEGDASKTLLRGMIEEAYHPILAGLNLETATPDLLQQRFAKYGADNNVGSKCVSFFLALAKDAGISLSPYLLNKSRLGARQRVSMTPTPSPPRRRRSSSSASGNFSARYDNGLTISPLTTKLPDFDPGWPKEVRDEWFEHVRALQTILAVMQKFPAFDTGWAADVQVKWFDCMRELLAMSPQESVRNRR